MTRLVADWLTHPGTRAVCAALMGGGHEALFVGGCVRNALLDEPVSDIDIATDAPPDRVLALAEDAGLKAVPTGIDHGTVTIIADGKPFEVTTFRRDVETDGRRAVVAFSTDVTEDARRRDFTMNALYARPDGMVLDPLGSGLEDLHARRLRFIDDPAARIREDYLRILRFFRFHAFYGDPQEGLDAEGLAACAALSAGIETLSKERIGQEMSKLLSASDPAPSLAAMEQAGCLLPVLPGASARNLPILVHLETASQTDPDAMRRLAVLGGDDPATKLRLSNANAKRHDLIRTAALGVAGTAEIAYRHGAEIARDAMLVRSALIEAPLPATLEADIETGAHQTLPITAADLMPEYSGKALGDALREAEARWIASGFTLGRDDLIG